MTVWREKVQNKAIFKATILFIAMVAGIVVFEEMREGVFSFRPYHLKSWLALLGEGSGNTVLQEPALENAESLPVLLYHGIVGEEDAENVRVEKFIEHMRVLHNAGYKTVTLEEMEKFLNGEATLPVKSFLLTFDDGARESYYPVDPILKSLGFTAVSFIITGSSLYGADTTYYLSEDAIKEMVKSGRWEIQSHGKDDHDDIDINENLEKGHFLSNRKWLSGENRMENTEEYAARIKTDLAESREKLEKDFGVPVNYFSFPLGDYGLESVNSDDAVAIIGREVRNVYKRVFYQTWEDGEFTQNYVSENPFMLRRIKVRPKWSGEELLYRMDGGYAKKLPYIWEGVSRDGWQSAWGKVNNTSNGLELSGASTTGATTFLDGGASWGDYIYEARFVPAAGNSFSAIARFSDVGNYVSCTIVSGKISLEEYSEGRKSVLANGGTGEGAFLGSEHAIRMELVGDNATCAVDGTDRISAGLSGGRKPGGVGFSIWSNQPDSSEILIKKVSVEPYVPGGSDNFEVNLAFNYSSSFRDDFDVDRKIKEVGSTTASADNDWWLSSGAVFTVSEGMGSTLKGNLPSDSEWAKKYKVNDPLDTNSGLRPQNIFRMIQRAEWTNFVQTAYLRISDYNLSDSPNRNESNGILLFNRYLDENNLYYAGIRVDGHAVIKKKKEGKYFTLAETELIRNERYDRQSRPNLLPMNVNIGIRTVTRNLKNGEVEIILLADIEGDGNWKNVLSTRDNGSVGGSQLSNAAHAGIRLDFMDVDIDSYEVSEIAE